MRGKIGDVCAKNVCQHRDGRGLIQLGEHIVCPCVIHKDRDGDGDGMICQSPSDYHRRQAAHLVILQGSSFIDSIVMCVNHYGVDRHVEYGRQAKADCGQIKGSGIENEGSLHAQ